MAENDLDTTRERIIDAAGQLFAERGFESTTVRDILVGTLVIDIADAKKGQLAWRGMGVKEVNTQANPEKRDKSINEAAKKIFKNYPPKVKK